MQYYVLLLRGLDIGHIYFTRARVFLFVFVLLLYLAFRIQRQEIIIKDERVRNNLNQAVRP